jgi:hypothetical protein
MFVLFYAARVMIRPANDKPASYELRSLIRFLQAKNMSTTEIHRESCSAVYSQYFFYLQFESTIRIYIL